MNNYSCYDCRPPRFSEEPRANRCFPNKHTCSRSSSTLSWSCSHVDTSKGLSRPQRTSHRRRGPVNVVRVVLILAAGSYSETAHKVHSCIIYGSAGGSRSGTDDEEEDEGKWGLHSPQPGRACWQLRSSVLRGGVPITAPGGGAGLTRQPPSTPQHRHFELSPDLNVLVLMRNLQRRNSTTCHPE